MPADRTDAARTRSATPSAACETRTGQPLSSTVRAPEPPAPSTPVRSPDRYQVINEHGRGGLGRVLRAHDRELGRDVAIKELIARGEVGEVRFLREAMITARLEHPGIVPIHEAGRWPDGTPFYAMKLVAGRSLRVLLAERKTVEARLALLDHVIAVADAIAYAHGRNIIHRDLKPANVIVGEFGETVVIDWGLAKDLGAAELGPSGGPYRAQPDHTLTSTGSVLGTPAYMAPEQERGEPADQRADVYALGAMLWELCGPSRTPPADPRARVRALRKNGIDRDLIAIICKALEPAPDRRYRDAGALAADLKAFTAGARIAARRYSRAGVLAHWLRRHRVVAGAALALVVAAAVTATLYVRGVTRERDRADLHAAEAIRHQREAEHAKDDLTLQHAELLLVTDPTAAHALLAGYRGDDPTRADLLRARAVALGVARFRVRPDEDQVQLIEALADGSLITASGNQIFRTSTAGASHAIAGGMTRQGLATVSVARGLVAYACDPAAICFVRGDVERALPAIDLGAGPSSLAFSPSGRQLAALTSSGALTVWAVPDVGPAVLARRHQLSTGVMVRFVDEARVVAVAQDHAEIVELAPTPRIASRAEIRDPVEIDVGGGEVAIATAHGELITTARGAWRKPLALCKGGLNNVAFVPGKDLLAYACQDGRTGTLETRGLAPALTLQIAGGCATIAVSPDGRFVAFGENAGGVQVHDARTGRVSRLLGHRGQRVTALHASATAIASADRDGWLAVWAPPSTAVELLFDPAERAIIATMLPANHATITTGAQSVSWLKDGARGQLEGHDPRRYLMISSKIYPDFILYGADDALELWHFADTPTRQIVRTDHPAVTCVRYRPGSLTYITAGSDGRLVEHAGDHVRAIATIDESIKIFAVLPGEDQLAVLGASGKLWRVEHGRVTALAASVNGIRTSATGRWLAYWTAADELVLIDATTWRRSPARLPAHVLDVAFANDDRELAAFTADAIERIAIGDAPAIPPGEARTALAVRSASYSPDGEWLAASAGDGLLWFWSRRTGTWSAHAASQTALVNGRFTADGKFYLVTDADHVFRVVVSALAGERSL
jgi:WD40 repeat protein